MGNVKKDTIEGKTVGYSTHPKNTCGHSSVVDRKNTGHYVLDSNSGASAVILVIMCPPRKLKTLITNLGKNPAPEAGRKALINSTIKIELQSLQIGKFIN